MISILLNTALYVIYWSCNGHICDEPRIGARVDWRNRIIGILGVCHRKGAIKPLLRQRRPDIRGRRARGTAEAGQQVGWQWQDINGLTASGVAERKNRCGKTPDIIKSSRGGQLAINHVIQRNNNTRSTNQRICYVFLAPYYATSIHSRTPNHPSEG